MTPDEVVTWLLELTAATDEPLGNSSLLLMFCRARLGAGTGLCIGGGAIIVRELNPPLPSP
jgi:hypothetical protein